MDTFHCMSCGRPQRDWDGTWFRSHGNYGSTVFDPMDGQYLDIVICDECLRAHAGRALHGRDHKPVLCGNRVVGRTKAHREPVPFDPEDRSLDGECLHVDEDELKAPWLDDVEWL